MIKDLLQSNFAKIRAYSFTYRAKLLLKIAGLPIAFFCLGVAFLWFCFCLIIALPAIAICLLIYKNDEEKAYPSDEASDE